MNLNNSKLQEDIGLLKVIHGLLFFQWSQNRFLEIVIYGQEKKTNKNFGKQSNSPQQLGKIVNLM